MCLRFAARVVCAFFFSYFFKVVIGRGGSKRIRKGGGENIEKKRAAGCVGYSRLELGLGWAGATGYIMK